MGNKSQSTLGAQIYRDMRVPAGSSGILSVSEENLDSKAVGPQPIWVDKSRNLPLAWSFIVCGPVLPAPH